MKKYLFLIAIGAAIFASCKPTEQNYRNAYDKAYEASQRKAAELTTASDGTKLESMYGARVETVGGQEIAITSVRVKPQEADPEVAASNKMALSVAKYSMITNARRNVEELKKDFPEAFIGYDGENGYYVLICPLPTMGDAEAPAKAFRKKYSEFPYIGLEGKPTVVLLRP